MSQNNFKKATAAGLAIAMAATIGAGVSNIPQAWATKGDAATLTIVPSSHQTNETSPLTYRAYQIFKADVTSAGKASDVAWCDSTVVKNNVLAFLTQYSHDAANSYDKWLLDNHIIAQADFDSRDSGTPTTKLAEERAIAQNALDYINSQWGTATTYVLPTSFAGQFADYLDNYGSANTDYVLLNSDNDYTTSALEEGFALVMTNPGTGNASTSPIFTPLRGGAGVTPTTIQEKTSVPTVEKKVQEDSAIVQAVAAQYERATEFDDTGATQYYVSDGADNYELADPQPANADEFAAGEFFVKTRDAIDANEGWQDAADADFEQIVNYKLTGTVSNDIAGFTTYQYIFNDTLTNLIPVIAGDTIAASDVVVKIDGKQVSTDSYSVSFDENVLSVAFTDLKAAVDGSGSPIALTGGSIVTVDYSAKIDTAHASFGTEGGGHPNTVKLQYSRDPMSNALGESEPDTVTVYTYDLQILKKDHKTNEPLSGVSFAFTGANVKEVTQGVAGQYVVCAANDANKVANVTTDANGRIDIKGLDEGSYTLTEISSSLPSGYNHISTPFQIVIDSDLVANPSTFSVTDSNSDSNYNDYITATANKASGVVSVDILNDKTIDLPATGQVAGVLGVIAGLVLVGGGIFIGVRARRKSHEEE